MKITALVPGFAALIIAFSAPANLTMAESADNAKSVCFSILQISNTQAPDDSTLLFYMRDGKIWKNTLPDRCFGLKMNIRGYTYTPTNPTSDTICSNLVTIRLNDTGTVCMLGAFTPYTPPPK